MKLDQKKLATLKPSGGCEMCGSPTVGRLQVRVMDKKQQQTIQSYGRGYCEKCLPRLFKELTAAM